MGRNNLDGDWSAQNFPEGRDRRAVSVVALRMECRKEDFGVLRGIWPALSRPNPFRLASPLQQGLQSAQEFRIGSWVGFGRRCRCSFFARLDGRRQAEQPFKLGIPFGRAERRVGLGGHGTSSHRIFEPVKAQKVAPCLTKTSEPRGMPGWSSPYFHCGGSDPRYAEIAIMSSSERFETTFFIRATSVPALDPF
jgi:hypothetical protein